MSTRSVGDDQPWRTATLGDVCEKITDGTHHSPSNGQTGDFKYVTAKNIRPSGLDLTDITYVDAATHRAIYSRCDVRKDDILYVKDGATTGRVALNTLEEEFSLLSSVGVLRPNRRCILPKYLLYALQAPTVKDRMLADVAGVAITRLTLKKLKAAEIPFAPLGQQAHIVTEIEKQFSRLEEAVANLKRVKANLDRYLAATLGEALSGNWAGTKADWEPVPLREVADVQLGQQRAPVHAADANPIPYVRAANVTWQGLALSDVKSMGFPNAARYRLAHGDILLAEASGSANEVGKPAIWRDEIPGACYQKTLIRVRCRPDLLNYEFAYYVFLHTARSGQFARLAPGVGILHLTAERMLVWPMVTPPLPVQASVVAEVDRRLSIVREVEAEVDANLKRAQALRQAVLVKAFGAER